MVTFCIWFTVFTIFNGKFKAHTVKFAFKYSAVFKKYRLFLKNLINNLFIVQVMKYNVYMKI